VIVEVEHVFVAIVLLRDSNLLGVAISEGVIGRGWAWYYDGDSEETVTQDALHPLSLYFGTPRVQWARLASSNTMHVLLFWSDVRRSELFPAVLEAELAGYAPIWTQVAAAPVGGLLPEYRIELTPTCTQRGSLELRFSGVSMDVRPESITKHLLGHLHMVSGNGRELTIAVEKPASAVHVFSGVPHGNYRAHFQVEDCGLRLPGGNESFAVQVGAQPAVLRVDLRGLGVVQVDVRDRSGASYDGSVTLVLTSKQGGARFYDFLKPPFVMEPVSPGEYLLHVDRLPGVDVMRQEAVQLMVHADEACLPVLPLK